MTTYTVTPSDNYLNLLANVVVDGDVTLWRAGTYAPVFVADTGFFKVAKAITLKNYPSEIPQFTFGSNDHKPIVYVSAGATLDGISVVGTYALGSSDTYAECNVLLAGTEPITIRNCNLTGFAHCGIKNMWGSPPLLIELCHIGSGGFDSRDHCVYIGTENNAVKVIRHCELHHATGAGLHLYNDEHNVLAYGNVMHHNAGWGALVTGSGHTIVNNVFGHNGKGLCMFHYDLADLLIQNNIAWSNAYDFYAELSEGETIAGTINHNCYGNCNSALMQGAGDITSDPKFLGSASWLDYRLTCGSPAKDIGVPVTGVTTLLDPRQLVLATKSVGALRSMGPWDYNG